MDRAMVESPRPPAKWMTLISSRCHKIHAAKPGTCCAAGASAASGLARGTGRCSSATELRETKRTSCWWTPGRNTGRRSSQGCPLRGEPWSADTHMSFIRRVDRRMVVNADSVGCLPTAARTRTGPCCATGRIPAPEHHRRRGNRLTGGCQFRFARLIRARPPIPHRVMILRIQPGRKHRSDTC